MARLPSTSPVVAVSCLLLFLICPLLYLLSFGPAAGLVRRGYLNEEAALKFYYPIKVLHRRCPPARPLLEQYVSYFE